MVVEQLLLTEPSEELPLLERLRERVDAASLLVSFNGKAFDRPMLDSRMVMNRMPALATRPHLDLLHVGRRLHRRRLGRCTLKILEREVLGFEPKIPLRQGLRRTIESFRARVLASVAAA